MRRLLLVSCLLLFYSHWIVLLLCSHCTRTRRFHPRWPGVVEGFYEFTHHYRQNNNNIKIEVYPFLLCESKLYVTNDEDFHKLYMQRILQDPSSLHEWASPFSHESSHIENKKWLYEMNGGIPYLRCDSSRLPSDPNVTQQIWLDRLY